MIQELLHDPQFQVLGGVLLWTLTFGFILYITKG